MYLFVCTKQVKLNRLRRSSLCDRPLKHRHIEGSVQMQGYTYIMLMRF